MLNPEYWALAVGGAAVVCGVAVYIIFGPRPWHSVRVTLLRAAIGSVSVTGGVLVFLMAVNLPALSAAVERGDFEALWSWLRSVLAWMVPIGALVMIAMFVRIRILRRIMESVEQRWGDPGPHRGP